MGRRSSYPPHLGRGGESAAAPAVVFGGLADGSDLLGVKSATKTVMKRFSVSLPGIPWECEAETAEQARQKFIDTIKLHRTEHEIQVLELP